jgi:hypothetical protein
MYQIIQETDYNGVVVIRMDIDGETLSVNIPADAGEAEKIEACNKRANEYLLSLEGTND